MHNFQNKYNIKCDKVNELLIKLIFSSTDKVNVLKYFQNPLQKIGCAKTKDKYEKLSWMRGLI